MLTAAEVDDELTPEGRAKVIAHIHSPENLAWERKFLTKVEATRGGPSPRERYAGLLKSRRAALGAKRRAAMLQRTPPWADLTAIKDVYAEAQRLTASTGTPHHVDHRIPLQGRLVSGLHVPNNLQILTASENGRKHNRFEVDP